MAPALPPGFEDLFTALNRTDGEVNIMGRVTDHLPPVPSRGADLMSTFSIADAQHGGDYGDGLKVRFFQQSENEHPQIRGTGDIVILRRLKIKLFRGVVMGLSSRGTSWTVFPAAEIPEKAPPNRLLIKNIKLPKTAEPAHSEMLYAIELCNLRDRKMDVSSGIPISSTGTLSTLSAPSPVSSGAPVSSGKTGGRAGYGGRDKFSLIKDLQLSTFYDIVGQVVKTYSTNGRLEMYITDYTSNNLLFRYEWDQEDKENHNSDYDSYYGSKSQFKKWPGPYGQMTLMVNLWPPHSHYAQSNVKNWDFVLLQNTHIKLSPDAKMEGALHEDRLYPSKIQISTLRNDDERVKDVLRRKRDYNEKFKTQSETFVKLARGQKELSEQGKEMKPLSKQAARRKRKLERQAAANAKEDEQAPSKKQKKKQKIHTDAPSAAPSTPTSPIPAPRPHPKPTRTDLNKNVHSSHHTIPITPLSTILSLDHHHVTTPTGITHTLPFQNLKTRATVRVIDFFPPNIADFAVRSRKASEFDALSDYERSDSGSDSEGERGDRRPPDSDDEALPNQGKRRRGSKGKVVGNVGEEEDEEQQWEWRFALILEDAESAPPPKGEERARMTAYVAQQDGDFLLKEDACDLRKNPTALETFREKLFLLWGDLEERMTAKREMPVDRIDKSKEPPQSKPFQCCLQEYGVRGGKAKMSTGREGEGEGAGDGEGEGWERRWRMFGTTII